jgi:hypothetical protein
MIPISPTHRKVRHAEDLALEHAERVKHALLLDLRLVHVLLFALGEARDALRIVVLDSTAFSPLQPHSCVVECGLVPWRVLASKEERIHLVLLRSDKATAVLKNVLYTYNTRAIVREMNNNWRQKLQLLARKNHKHCGARATLLDSSRLGRNELRRGIRGVRQ